MAHDTPDPAAIIYAPCPAGIDIGTYDLSSARFFAGDLVESASLGNLADLASSARWEDRIRAEVLRGSSKITMPDQFPCLFETADSPSQSGLAQPRPFVWVASPDIDMLTRLLPDYQELWDAYTAQWGPTARRTFAVGRLDGVGVYRVYRPGTSPETVIGSTMLTHSGMYAKASERLRRMHPSYDQWTAPKSA